MARQKRLNPQGLARRDSGLMKCITPDPDYTTVSIDLSAGEPTVTTELSRDRNYYDACFGMVKKAPYYDGGILRIDDIYLMTMSVSPIGADKMREMWEKPWPCGDFSTQWLADSEVIKKAINTERQFHKILALGLGYGMGAQKMVKSAYEKGYSLDLKTAKAFHRAYWELFAGVRRLADRLAQQVETRGYLVNPFGYRLTPDPRRAFNYMIQSSVSGIMHIFGAKLFAAAPWARFVACIHDEFLVDVPSDRLEEFRRIKDLATDSLNEDLKWSVKIRTGFVAGSTWYDAK